MRVVQLPEFDFNKLYGDQAQKMIDECLAAGATPDAYQKLLADALEHNAIYKRAVYLEVPNPTPELS